ncbi:hypothetical protein [Phytohabitans aurantiacus]|uniref:Uncharacterized protein n=1 Tax=Phytohabitans aurantiacus TaxID=3016789 RepID=A0ABQ5QTQ2_9ACTN|nr:hypothetical protein [Phytohabitans aurantiacus]GLH97094.1 hypothetical protein Pa4123_23680 [Phytohabitans aurantiacus]
MAFWDQVSQFALPMLPEALVLLGGLALMIAVRRRLGAAAPSAIGGCAFLALAGAGKVAWTLWLLSRFYGPIKPDSSYRPAGLDITLRLTESVNIMLTGLYLAGLILVTAAVFRGRLGTATPPVSQP